MLQFSGVPGVTLAVNQHQRVLNVVLDDTGDTGEMLEGREEPC